MSDKTAIEWTDATWNPVTGCTKVSPGCKHCYAEGVADRFWGDRKFTDVQCHEDRLLVPWRWVRGRRIFVNSMSDLFHEDVPFEFIAKVFWIMSVTTRHTYQVLTKRPQRMLEFFRWCADDGEMHDVWAASMKIDDCGMVHQVEWKATRAGRGGYDNCGPGWPYENVWLGVSVEDQETANERIPLLLKTPAAVHWISAEPLLGPIDLQREYLATKMPDGVYPFPSLLREHRTTLCDRLDWVVAGGESGPDARPMHPDWARALRDQCAAAGVPFLMKQWGEFVTVYDRDKEDPDYRRCSAVEHGIPNGRWLNLAGGHGFSGERVVYVERQGKRAAGRTLDGVIHDGYPA